MRYFLGLVLLFAAGCSKQPSQVMADTKVTRSEVKAEMTGSGEVEVEGHGLPTDGHPEVE